MRMDGRHVLVTGAASGIGRATAHLLARLGARLTLIDRDEEGLQGTLEGLGDGGHLVLAADLRDLAGIEALMLRSADRNGLLQGAVHAAGIQRILPAKALTPEGWRELMTVNAEAGLALARAFPGRKISGGGPGSIVFISSVIGLAGSPGAVAYSMSKGALHGLTASLALEFAPKRIRVNCVAPGFVRTPLFDRTASTWDAATWAAVEARHPLGFGEPEDVANAAAFLLADTGRWITGTVLVADGGYLAQ